MNKILMKTKLASLDSDSHTHQANPNPKRQSPPAPCLRSRGLNLFSIIFKLPQLKLILLAGAALLVLGGVSREPGTGTGSSRWVSGRAMAVGRRWRLRSRAGTPMWLPVLGD